MLPLRKIEIVIFLSLFLPIFIITIPYFLQGKITLDSFLTIITGTLFFLFIVIFGIRKGISWLSESFKVLNLYPQLFLPYTLIFIFIVGISLILYLFFGSEYFEIFLLTTSWPYLLPAVILAPLIFTFIIVFFQLILFSACK